MHACYKGSRFVQASLWFVLCAASWRSDPVKVWMIKAAEACARQARTHGLDLMQRVWEAGGRLGPVAGLQAVLLAAGVEATLEGWVADGVVLRDPLLASVADRKAFILGAVQAADLRKAASRKGQTGLNLGRSKEPQCQTQPFCYHAQDLGRFGPVGRPPIRA